MLHSIFEWDRTRQPWSGDLDDPKPRCTARAPGLAR